MPFFRPLLSAGLTAVLSAVAAPAAAQFAWETPRMIGPSSPEGFGVHWVRGGTLRGDGDAAFVTWSASALPAGVSLRFGAGEGIGGSIAGFGGVDVRAPLARARPGQPFDLAWTTGAGVGVRDHVLITLPIGVSGGRSWSSGSVWFAPYVSVGLALDVRIGDVEGAEEFDASPSLDLGLDLAFDAGRNFVLRAGTSLGDRQAIAVGALVRGGP